MKIRQLGQVLFREYPDDGDRECAWCEAGAHTDWGPEGGVIFFENDRGEVQRLEGERLASGLVMIKCIQSSQVQAALELGGWQPSTPKPKKRKKRK